jgi:hypothetical protein
MKTIAIILLTLLVYATAGAEERPFYYSFKNRIFLEIDSTRFLVEFNNSTPQEGYQFIIHDFPNIAYDSTFRERLGNFGLFVIDLESEYDLVDSLLRINQYTRFVNPVFKLDDTLSTFIRDDFICQFSQSTPPLYHR